MGICFVFARGGFCLFASNSTALLCCLQGNYWREQRRFTLRNLRDFGFGKASMESALNEEVQKLIEFMRPKMNQPLSLGKPMSITTLNALWSILTGEKLELDDPKLNDTLDAFEKFLRNAEGPTSAVGCLLPFPKLLMIPLVKKLMKIDTLELFFNRIFEMLEPLVQSHQSSLDENNVRDFMDLYLLKIKETSNPHSSFHSSRGVNSMKNLLTDLFMAGMETTSSSLAWAFLYLLKNPDCQSKIWREIQTEIGMDRLPSLDDKSRMPYTNAFLLEALRSASLIPLSVFHYTFSDLQIKGFTIPKDSAIISSLYHVHHDPRFFTEPEQFRPERFLNQNGQFVNDEHVVPFGIGKRNCLGKSLGEKQYFLFFVGMLQNFEICPVPGVKLPKTGVEDVHAPGLARLVPHYEVILKPRK